MTVDGKGNQLAVEVVGHHPDGHEIVGVRRQVGALVEALGFDDIVAFHGVFERLLGIVVHFLLDNGLDVGFFKVALLRLKARKIAHGEGLRLGEVVGMDALEHVAAFAFEGALKDVVDGDVAAADNMENARFGVLLVAGSPGADFLAGGGEVGGFLLVGIPVREVDAVEFVHLLLAGEALGKEPFFAAHAKEALHCLFLGQLKGHHAVGLELVGESAAQNDGVIAVEAGGCGGGGGGDNLRAAGRAGIGNGIFIAFLGALRLCLRLFLLGALDLALVVGFALLLLLVHLLHLLGLELAQTVFAGECLFIGVKF